ncbi:MAG: hypothetical protein GXP55_00040 [Deltaproteobacteria bacterium]|nr:hypothetical protein [Deltaproteobacteria bacterium]
MAWGSVAVGALSFIMMVAGFLLSWVPVLGSLLSFGAPVVAIAGVVMGGVAMSRAKQMGQESGAAVAGLIVSIIAFFPALLFALTCGMCNACVTAGALNPNSRRRMGQGGFPFPAPTAFGDAGKPSTSPFGLQPTPPDAAAGSQGYPPPAFPPPPVPGASGSRQVPAAPPGAAPKPADPPDPGDMRP